MAFDAKYCPDAIYNPTRSVLLNDENYLYRLREHPEKDDPDYVSVLRDPDGAHDACELSDTFYFTPGQGAQPRIAGYHEHRKGFELFMVGGEGAKCLIRVRGRQTWAYSGDMIFLPPATPHSFLWYGNPLRWREMFSGMRMNPGGNANWRILEFHPDAHDDPEFEAVYQTHSDYIAHDHPTRFADADDIPEVIRFDAGAAAFELGGVRIRGVAEFVAKPWDYIDLPAWLDAELTVLSDEAVVYDMNCQGYLYSALEEIAMRAPGEPGLLADEAALRAILRKNDVRLFGVPRH